MSIITQGQDQSLKFISNEYLKEFLNMLPTDIGLKIDENTEIEILTEEQIVFEPSLYRPDFIVRLDNIILMLEFQSTSVGTMNKKRFISYIANFDLKNNEENFKIFFAVISTAENSKIAKYVLNEHNIFSFPIISLFNDNVGEIISNIKEKINKQEDFNDDELIEFALTPIMHRSREKIIKQFEYNVDLMDQITYKNGRIRNSTYGIALMLSNMYFAKDDPMRKKIQGDYMMKVDCVSEAIHNSEIKGEIKGQIKMVKNLLNRGKLTFSDAIGELVLLDCDLDTISEITGLSESEINRIMNQD